MFRVLRKTLCLCMAITLFSGSAHADLLRYHNFDRACWWSQFVSLTDDPNYYHYPGTCSINGLKLEDYYPYELCEDLCRITRIQRIAPCDIDGDDEVRLFEDLRAFIKFLLRDECVDRNRLIYPPEMDQCLAADFNGDGKVDSLDIDPFLECMKNAL